jgi:hypothetical protein
MSAMKRFFYPKNSKPVKIFDRKKFGNYIGFWLFSIAVSFIPLGLSFMISFFSKEAQLFFSDFEIFYISVVAIILSISDAQKANEKTPLFYIQIIMLLLVVSIYTICKIKYKYPSLIMPALSFESAAFAVFNLVSFVIVMVINIGNYISICFKGSSGSWKQFI